MIHGLIDDSECNVEEVIQRVSSAYNASTSQTEESANRSTSVLTLPSTTPTTTAPPSQEKSHDISTVVAHAPLEVCYFSRFSLNVALLQKVSFAAVFF